MDMCQFYPILRLSDTKLPHFKFPYFQSYVTYVAIATFYLMETRSKLARLLVLVLKHRAFDFKACCEIIFGSATWDQIRRPDKSQSFRPAFFCADGKNLGMNLPPMIPPQYTRKTPRTLSL